MNREAEIQRQREWAQRNAAVQRRIAWGEIQSLGFEQIVRDVVSVFGKLGGLPVVTRHD